MQVRYDFHIHSGLSPCADKDMTPVTIVAYAQLSGIGAVAIADHNAIANVEVALRAGEAFGVTVVPAMELQTAEDIHILCLFQSFEDLKGFFDTLEFQNIKNRADIFGEQLIFDEEDEVVGCEERLLLVSSTMYSYEVKQAVEKFGGLAIPAHVDREANGMLQILGDIPEEFAVIEMTPQADESLRARWTDRHILTDSDAHTLADIQGKGEIQLENNDISSLFASLSGYYTK